MTRPSRAIVSSFLLAGFIGVGCTGNIGNPAGPEGAFGASSTPGARGGSAAPSASSSSSDDTASQSISVITSSVQCSKAPVGISAPLRALNPVQYANAVRDTFGGRLTASTSYPRQVGTSLTGYSTDSARNALAGGFAEAVADAADDTAGQVFATIGQLVSCASAKNRACAEKFVDTYATKAFRRPLLAEDRDALLAEFDAAMTEHKNFEAAIAELTSAILQHPRFLYLPEFGTLTNGQRTLDDYELASRLSFLLWDTLPDDELLRAAGAGELTKDVANVKKQADRMVKAQTFEPVLTKFVKEWIGVPDVAAGSKDATLFPELDATLASALGEELNRFVLAAVKKGAGGFEALIKGRDTFVNAPLAKLYGVTANTTSATSWVPVTLGTDRPGLMTRAAVLAGFAGPTEPSHVRRGKFVRTQLLCGKIAPPPANAQAMQPAYPANATRRQKSEILQQTQPCGGCHVQLDPIGLSFDNFDALGKRLSGNIDVSGTLNAAGDLTGQFSGAEQLADLLSDSTDVRECVGRQWFRYAFGRIEGNADACTYADVASTLGETNGDLSAMLISIATADGFRFRKTTGE
jgi:hypothetical protein